ncbi:MAG: type IV pilus assembly protein PilB, partial [uncultured bacterium]
MVEPKKRLRLGDALLQDGLVNEEQLQKALEIQKQSGKRLGAVLVEMGVVTENDIVTVLGKQLGIPYINLSNYLIDPATVRIIPENIARRHQLIPINKVGNKLTVAMVDPLNILAIDDIQFMTGLVVKPVVATSTDINEALNNAYGNEGKMDELMEDLGDIGKDANEGGDLGNLEELDENDAPIIRLVNLVISNAVTEGVSDIHIEPFDKDIRIRYRLDGDL